MGIFVTGKTVGEHAGTDEKAFFGEGFTVPVYRGQGQTGVFAPDGFKDFSCREGKALFQHFQDHDPGLRPFQMLFYQNFVKIGHNLLLNSPANLRLFCYIVYYVTIIGVNLE
jgi:hypothetical protein